MGDKEVNDVREEASNDAGCAAIDSDTPEAFRGDRMGMVLRVSADSDSADSMDESTSYERNAGNDKQLAQWSRR